MPVKLKFEVYLFIYLWLKFSKYEKLTKINSNSKKTNSTNQFWALNKDISINIEISYYELVLFKCYHSKFCTLDSKHPVAIYQLLSLHQKVDLQFGICLKFVQFFLLALDSSRSIPFLSNMFWDLRFSTTK